MEGTTCGFWKVDKFLGRNANDQTVYWCICVCGTEREVVAQALREGKSVSCGCKKSEITAEKLYQEGQSEGRTTAWTPEYRAWMSMRRRVSPGNKKMKALYSDRGITICARWDSFDNFLADMGKIPRPGWTLDREDNDKGYDRANCRWADCQTQAQNRRQNQIRWPRKAA